MIRFGSFRNECVLDDATPRHVLDDESAEVSSAVLDGDLFDRRCRILSRPGSLTCRPVTVEPRTAGDDPVVQAFTGLGEVLVPAEGSGAMLLSRRELESCILKVRALGLLTKADLDAPDPYWEAAAPVVADMGQVVAAVAVRTADARSLESHRAAASATRAAKLLSASLLRRGELGMTMPARGTTNTKPPILAPELVER